MPTVLILGAGSDMAVAIARKYASAGYSLQLAARNPAVTTAPPPVPTNTAANAEAPPADDILHIRPQFAAGSGASNSFSAPI